MLWALLPVAIDVVCWPLQWHTGYKTMQSLIGEMKIYILIVVTDELMLKTGDYELLQELLSSSDRHCSLTKSKKYFGSAKIRTQAGCLRSEIIFLCARPLPKARACWIALRDCIIGLLYSRGRLPRATVVVKITPSHSACLCGWIPPRGLFILFYCTRLSTVPIDISSYCFFRYNSLVTCRTLTNQLLDHPNL